ncbi:MAG: O-acetylhomoserine aminocarboxypropyltransferase/cysteine synthase [Bacteroidales bacterium]|nr:O-acetylhomoserine aminocarboxypropyltransferase/cysteine synthase [Candidatus Cryptobacteroides onthequi]
MTKKPSIATMCVQAGYNPKRGESRQIPIIQSTTFKYENSDQMARLFDLEDSGYFYTRLANPTNDMVAAKIAALEGGVAAMLTSSGQAANFYACFNICNAGDHIVSAASIYGGTFNLLGTSMAKMGIEVTFIDQDASEEEIAAAFKPNTKLLFGEMISNPGVAVLDVEKFARIAHSHGVPLIVDNTFATPVHCRPFEWGADIVTHSTTKYMDGHGVSVGGVIVDSGNFDWEANAEKYPGLCTPDESYHGLTYTKKFGKLAYITKATSQLMRDFGSIQSPQNAFYINLGLQSLHVRVKQHSESAKKVAEFLSSHPMVSWVNYSDLPGDKYHDLQQKYLPDGSCGVIAWGLKGGRDVAIRFMDNLQFVTIETHVADCYTCILHPASHTHRQMTDEQLIEAGAAPDLIRLSIGLEDPDDIIADIEQAIEKAVKE